MTQASAPPIADLIADLRETSEWEACKIMCEAADALEAGERRIKESLELIVQWRNAAYDSDAEATVAESTRNAAKRQARREALEEAAKIADVWGDAKANLEASTNKSLALVVASVCSDAGHKIAAAIRALK